MVLIVCGNYDGALQGWQGSSIDSDMKLVVAYRPHQSCAKCLAVSQPSSDSKSSKRYLASGGTDEFVKVYDLDKMVEMGELLEHTNSVISVAFIGNKFLLSGGEDSKLLLWRCKDWQLVANLKGHKAGPVTSIAVHPSGKLALTTSNDNSLRAWNLENCRPASRNKIKDAKILNMCQWSPSGNFYAVVSNNLNVHLFSVEADSGVPTHSLALGSKINSIAFLSDSSIVVGCDNGSLVLLDITNDVMDVKYTLDCPSRIRSIAAVAGLAVCGLSSGKILCYKAEKKSFVLAKELDAGSGSHLTCLAGLNDADVALDRSHESTDRTPSTVNKSKRKPDSNKKKVDYKNVEKKPKRK